ncbi:MAG: tetratricopeptide repeat protein, partial [Anaerolineae bacterium]|nr:tetratricopeptide repeat protein [Anaerolineae bacterium]
PLLTVSTYRSDEKPGLADRFPMMQHIHLERLSSSEIAQLSESMLGASGRGEDVLELLRRETEGNVFFLIETVRALAEEAGNLDNVGRMTLPPTVFAGGVQKVVERRLNQVPEMYHPLLKCAAIAGRQIDLDVLQQIADVNVDDWLTVCANSAVLAVQDGRWRFAHDKLREGLLGRIEDEEMRHFSRQIAEALEKLYPYDDSLAQLLALHWQKAGDPEKEAYYSYMAGRQQKIANPQEARVFLHRALSLMGEEHPNVADVYRMLGDVYVSLSEHSLAQHYFETCLEIARKQNMNGHIARSLHGLGTIAERHAQYDIARERFEEGLRFAKENGQAELLALLLNGLGGVLLEEGHYQQARESLESSLQLALSTDDKPIITQNYNNLGVLCFRQGDFTGAETYFKKALEIRREAGMRQGVASGLNNLGVLATARGKFGEALAYHKESYDLKKELGDRYGMSTSVYNMAVAAMNLGQLGAADSSCRGALALSNEEEHRGNVGDSLNLLAIILLRHNDNLAEARGLLQNAIEILAEISEPLGHALAQANLSDVLLKLGEAEEAKQRLLDALRGGSSLGATQPIFRALLGMGKYYAQQGAQERAVLLLSFINLEPRCDEETRADTETALQTFVHEMSAERMVEMIQASKNLKLDTVVQSILEDPAHPIALIPPGTADEAPTMPSLSPVDVLLDDPEATVPARPIDLHEHLSANQDRLEFPALDEADQEPDQDDGSARSDASK